MLRYAPALLETIAAPEKAGEKRLSQIIKVIMCYY